MFNIFRRKKEVALQILFHTAANNHPEHGTIVADHKTFGLSNYPVRFSIVGSDGELKATQKLINHVFAEAVKAGFTVHHLRSFAGVAPVYNNKVSSEQVREFVTNTPNHQAMKAHYEELRVNEHTPRPTATRRDPGTRVHPLHPAHPDHQVTHEPHPAYPSRPRAMPYSEFKATAPV